MSTTSIASTTTRRSSYSAIGLDFKSHPVDIVGDVVSFPPFIHILDIDCVKENWQKCLYTGLAERNSRLLLQAIVDQIVLLPFS